jgi:hypothetical protein
MWMEKELGAVREDQAIENGFIRTGYKILFFIIRNKPGSVVVVEP